MSMLPNPFESLGRHPREEPAVSISPSRLDAAGSTISECSPGATGSLPSGESDLQVTADFTGAAAIPPGYVLLERELIEDILLRLKALRSDPDPPPAFLRAPRREYLRATQRGAA